MMKWRRRWEAARGLRLWEGEDDAGEEVRHHLRQEVVFVGLQSSILIPLKGTRQVN